MNFTTQQMDEMEKNKPRTFNLEQLAEIEKLQRCITCEYLEDMEWECPDEPHHGEDTVCGECQAEYYREYNGKTYAQNKEAKFNHPELETI